MKFCAYFAYFLDLMWDRQTTDAATKTEGCHTVSVRA